MDKQRPYTIIQEKFDLSKFVVIVLLPLIVGLYTLFNFLHSTTIENYLYVNLYKSSIFAGLSLFFIVLYMFFKGFSNDINIQHNDYAILKFLTDGFHKLFLISLFLIPLYLLLSFLLLEIPSKYAQWQNFLIICSILFFLLVIGGWVVVELWNFLVKRNYFGEKNFIITNDLISFLFGSLKIIGLLIFCMLIWSTPFSYFLDPLIPIPGQIIIDKENFYYKNQTTIHFLVKVNGPDTGISMRLLKDNSGYFNPIATLNNIEPRQLKSSSNSSLLVYSLGDGKYRVFVNTTNISAGYYQLKIEIYQYEKIQHITDFYIT